MLLVGTFVLFMVMKMSFRGSVSFFPSQSADVLSPLLNCLQAMFLSESFKRFDVNFVGGNPSHLYYV